MEENYVTILKECLEKKEKVLEEIFQQNIIQKRILMVQEFDDQAFESSIHRKDELLGELAFLDYGFENLYRRVREQITMNKERYAYQIADMKKLIHKITELNLSVQAQEQENKKALIQRFQSERKGVRKVRTSNAAATKYYQNMSQLNVVDPQFMDKKK